MQSAVTHDPCVSTSCVCRNTGVDEAGKLCFDMQMGCVSTHILAVCSTTKHRRSVLYVMHARCVTKHRNSSCAIIEYRTIFSGQLFYRRQIHVNVYEI